jgi:tetratricopeptide (TPR) repeat protein
MKKTLYKSTLYLVLLGLFLSLCSRKSDKYISQALLLVDSIEGEFQRNITMGTIASHYADIGLHEQAMVYANTIQDSESKDMAFFTIALTHLHNGKTQRAIETIEYIISNKQKIITLTSIAYCYADSNNFDEASKILKRCLALADHIENDDEYVCAIINIAEVYIKMNESAIVDSLLTHAGTRTLTINIAQTYVKNNQIDEALEIARKNYDVTKALDSEYQRYSNLFNIVGVFVICDRKDLALNAITYVSNTEFKNGSLARIVKELVNTGRYDEGLDIVSLIKHSGWKEIALNYIAMAYAKNGNYEESIETTKMMKDASSITRILCYTSKKYYEIGENAIADSLLNDALKMADSTDDYDEKSTALLHIVREYRRREMFHQANDILTTSFESARSIEDGYKKNVMLSSISNEYAKINQYKQADIVVNEINDNFLKIMALLTIDTIKRKQ